MSSKSDVRTGLRPADTLEGVVRQLVEELESIDSGSRVSTCSALLIECFSMMVFRVAKGELDAPSAVLEQLSNSALPYLRKFERNKSFPQTEVAALLRLVLALLQAADLSLSNLREIDSHKLNATEREVLYVLFEENRPLKVADVHKLLDKKVSSQWVGQVLSNLADSNLVRWIPTKGQGAKIVYLYQISPSGRYVATESRVGKSVCWTSRRPEPSSSEMWSAFGKCLEKTFSNTALLRNAATLDAFCEVHTGLPTYRSRIDKSPPNQAGVTPLYWWLEDHTILGKPALAQQSAPKQQETFPLLGQRETDHLTKWVYSGGDNINIYRKETATHGC